MISKYDVMYAITTGIQVGGITLMLYDSEKSGSDSSKLLGLLGVGLFVAAKVYEYNYNKIVLRIDHSIGGLESKVEEKRLA